MPESFVSNFMGVNFGVICAKALESRESGIEILKREQIMWHTWGGHSRDGRLQGWDTGDRSLALKLHPDHLIIGRLTVTVMWPIYLDSH